MIRFMNNGSFSKVVHFFGIGGVVWILNLSVISTHRYDKTVHNFIFNQLLALFFAVLKLEFLTVWMLRINEIACFCNFCSIICLILA